MSATDALDYVGIAVGIVWLLWLWWTVSNTLLKPGYPQRLAAKAAVPVILVGLVLMALGGLLLSVQGPR